MWLIVSLSLALNALCFAFILHLIEQSRRHREAMLLTARQVALLTKAIEFDWQFAKRTQRGLMLCWACLNGVMGHEDIILQGDGHDPKSNGQDGGN